MKIGKPGSLPSGLHKGRSGGRWEQIWIEIEKLNDGDWLPVTLDSEKEAAALSSAAIGHRRFKLEVRKRRLDLWIRKGQSK